jgi:hypothetical protein
MTATIIEKSSILSFGTRAIVLRWSSVPSIFVHRGVASLPILRFLSVRRTIQCQCRKTRHCPIPSPMFSMYERQAIISDVVDLEGTMTRMRLLSSMGSPEWWVRLPCIYDNISRLADRVVGEESFLLRFGAA